MAKKSVVARNKRREELSKKSFTKRAELKNVVKGLDTSYEEKVEAMKKLRQMPKDASYIRVRNRCNLTGRGRGYYRFLGLSRMTIRRLAAAGFMPGLMKGK